MNKKFCFTHPSGKPVYEITLVNARGTEVKLTNLGVILMAYKLKTPTGFTDIVLGFDHVEDYMSTPYLKNYTYFGAAIGRYGNRIKNAQFKIDTIEYHVTANIGQHQLHGGAEGFDKKVWDIVEEDTTASSNIVIMQYVSVDGEEGFPGNLTVTIRFELLNDDSLSYEFIATTDKATAINLTHHSYFNLNGGDGNIFNHQLTIDADTWLEQDEDLVVTGRQISVVDTPSHDFRVSKTISRDLDVELGYDQCFVLNHIGFNTPQAQCFSTESGIQLDIYTDEPCMQFYSAKWLSQIVGKNNSTYGPYSAFCLETQKAPNSINLIDYPSTILKPGDTYRTKTMYKPHIAKS